MYFSIHQSIKVNLNRVLFWLVRSRAGSWLIRELIQRMNDKLPIKQLFETNDWLVFPHPSPAYRVHVLIIPKSAASSLVEMSPAQSLFLAEIPGIVHQLVELFQLNLEGYRLITNGGAYQEVKILHFHFVAGESASP
jgi:histidine triad (HIT) family protein